MDMGWAKCLLSKVTDTQKKKKRELYCGETQQILSQQIKDNNSDITLKLSIYVQWEIYFVFLLAPDIVLLKHLEFSKQ